MTWYTFGTVPVYDPVTDTVVENAVGGQLVAVKDGPAYPIRDLNASPLAQITSNGNGQSSQFQAETLTGLVQFGEVCVTVWANELGGMLLSVLGAITIATDAAASASAAEAAASTLALRNNDNGAIVTAETDPILIKQGTAAEWNASSFILRSGQPGVAFNPDGTVDLRIGDGANIWTALDPITGGGGGGGPITAADITDSTVFSRQLVTAANQAAALSTLGLAWLYVGAGSPEGVVTAAVGSLYRNTSGAVNSTLYSKETGSGNTGWKALGGVVTTTTLGLQNVTNTSDANKPVSTAQQTALNSRSSAVYWSGSAWPARPSDAPAFGLNWYSTNDAAATAPTVGTTAGHNGDLWWRHPSAV